MPKAILVTAKGTKKEIELNDAFLCVHASEGLIHEAVRRYRASLRQGTHETKTRSEVRGGGRKPWPQKGTGRARAGTIRSPLWKGGGVVFGPHLRDYSFDIPKKQRRKSLAASLTYKVEAGEFLVIESDKFKEAKTKAAVEFLNKAGLSGKKLTIAALKNEVALIKSFRNLPDVEVVDAEGLNPYLVLDNEIFAVTQKALERLREVFS